VTETQQEANATPAGALVALVTGPRTPASSTSAADSVHDGTEAIIAYALGAPGGPAGTYRGRDGGLPW